MGVNYLMPSRFAVSVLSLLAEGNPVRRPRAIKSDQTRLDRINKINRMHEFPNHPVHPVNPVTMALQPVNKVGDDVRNL